MSKKFSLLLVCKRIDKPRVDRRVIEYLEQFVLEEILQPYNIIISAKPNVILSLASFEFERHAIEIKLLHTQRVYGDKLSTIVIPFNLIEENRSLENLVILYFKAIEVFFLANYKKLNKSIFDHLREKLDMDYLSSIPYPASDEDVNYVGGLGTW
jgi:uncharacterized protein with ParB-like and HNH nuclease domain